ncbi:RHS repeat-associated core domain-containing protein [Cyanobacterium aponinum UTEX 3222]|nr:RHS repeat-associated core domain-containing protein [Cyanobacterium aponinum UTEX 3222]
MYDTDNSTQTTLDVFGNPTTYVYDDRGNVLTEVDPVGKITERTYDDRDNVLIEKIIADGKEYLTTYTYDQRNNVLTQTDALGNTDRYTYNKFNKLLTITDALGNTIKYTYDDRGNVLSRKDAEGNIVRYTYDRFGNNLSKIEGENDITYYEYDNRGNKIKETDALGNVTTYTHDINGNVLTETMTLTTSSGERTLVTTYTYDGNNNQTSVLDAEGNLTQYQYDANNNQTAIIDALGRRVINRYDEKNNLIETIYPDDTPEDLSDNLRTKTEYDKAGNKISVTDQTGNITYYDYDPNNLPTGLIMRDDTPEDLTDNPRISVTYDKFGQMTVLLNELGNRAEYEYDEVGRINLTRQFIDGQPVETRTTYNAVGDTLTTTDAYGRVTEFVYDKNGELIETIFNDGTSIKTEYDAMGNKIAETDQANNTTYYEYDALDQLIAVVDANNHRTEYEYDEMGNLVLQRDANGNETRWEYDGLGRQTTTIRPLGQKAETFYNPVGNVIRTVDFNGEEIIYDYNDINLLTQKTFADSTTVEYSYEDDRLVSVIDERGETTFSYNDLGRLLSRVEPDGKSISYTYNNVGQLESIITDGQTIAYTYDTFGRLDTVTADNGVTDYDYDLVGNLIETTLPNGVVETREYDQLYRLIGVENVDGDGGNILSSYDYTLDEVGNRLLVEELNGGRSVAFAYDDTYRLISETITDAVNGDLTITYDYDAVGNRLSMDNSITGLTTYTYNRNDWLLSESIAGVTTTYTYDDNGNTLTKSNADEQVVYDWNQENHLVGVEIINGDGVNNIEYQYDMNGIRVASIVDGFETRYLIDANREYAQALEEYDSNGDTQVIYVHGWSLISQSRGGEDSFYGYDGHSGVRILTDESGNVTDIYNYDGYGNVISSSGDTENSYLYRGEQFDNNLQMQYLRARYYDPNLGRFPSVDPFEGVIESPISRHRYAYGANNPITYFDPSGEVSIGQALGGSIGSNVLLSLNILAVGVGLFGTVSNILKRGNPQPKITWTGDIGIKIGDSASSGNFGNLLPTQFLSVEITSLKGTITATSDVGTQWKHRVSAVGVGLSASIPAPNASSISIISKAIEFNAESRVSNGAGPDVLYGAFNLLSLDYLNPIQTAVNIFKKIPVSLTNTSGIRMGVATGYATGTSYVTPTNLSNLTFYVGTTSLGEPY